MHVHIVINNVKIRYMQCVIICQGHGKNKNIHFCLLLGNFRLYKLNKYNIVRIKKSETPHHHSKLAYWSTHKGVENVQFELYNLNVLCLILII